MRVQITMSQHDGEVLDTIEFDSETTAAPPVGTDLHHALGLMSNAKPGHGAVLTLRDKVGVLTMRLLDEVADEATN
jgi:hypothetical protein